MSECPMLSLIIAMFTYFSKTWIHFANNLVDSVLPLHFSSVYFPVQYREYVISTGSIWFGVFPDYLLACIT